MKKSLLIWSLCFASFTISAQTGVTCESAKNVKSGFVSYSDVQETWFNSSTLDLPFSIYRLVLALCMTILFVLGLTIGSSLFSIVDLSVIRDFIFDVLIIVIVNFIILNLLFEKVLKV